VFAIIAPDPGESVMENATVEIAILCKLIEKTKSTARLMVARSAFCPRG
jgi:hypothetical protein